MSYVLYKLNKTERTDMDRYLKNLALKFAQVICQARMGHKVHSDCEPNPTLRNFWVSQNECNFNHFNVAISDLPEVNAETRKALGVSGSGDNRSEERSIVSSLPLCIEITLKTDEGYDMLLELWTLTIIPELNSPAIRTLHTIYGTFGSLLKSIIAVSRATPAYKLSRRTSETYRITHAISAGKQPDLTRLGEDFKQFRIGQTCTVFGTVNMSVAYRTKMTISPTQTGRDSTKIMLKSDHFLNDLSPKQNRYYNIRNNDKQTIDLDKPMRPGAFVDISQLKKYTEEEHILPEIPPFSWLLKKTQGDLDDISVTDEDMPPTAKVTPLRNNNNKNSDPIDVAGTRVASHHTIAGANIESPISSPRSLSDSRSLSRLLSKDDDPLLFKELHLPFATDNTPISDLARFYRDCFNAPPLSQDKTHSTGMESTLRTSDEATLIEVDERDENDDDVDELTRQLDRFETSLNDYDTLFTSLCCQSEIDSNSNS